MNEQRIKNCPACGEPMKNLGNVSGIVLTSNPPQWDVVWVCDKDQMKHTERVHGQVYTQPNLSNYVEVSND